jgi:ABC-type Na+ efflux pump permease subunit
MKPILTIAKREVNRLRSRFRGRSQPLTLIILAGALLLSFLAFRNVPGPGAGLYRVGVSPDGPRIQDSRFSTLVVDRPEGDALLKRGAVDVYVDGNQVVARQDAKSQYAVGALKKYLENQELERISKDYDLAQAFPLRVEVNYTAQSQVGAIANLVNASRPSTAATGGPSIQAAPTPNGSDAAVRQQIKEAESGGGISQLKIEPPAATQILVPSLSNPPLPFGQVMLAFLYILPVSFISVFFTSSFMDEKTNRRLVLLFSAPVTPFQIIIGKLLPYAGFSVVVVSGVAWVTGGSVPLALAIFAPAMLFIFAIYLMVPLLYRTFKDVTFISMLATAVTTSYLIFPAMFSGINDLAYISPLTLAVKMYRGEPFGLKEYVFATAPLYLFFGLSLYVATRVLNEEYLMGFRPLYRKLADALYLVLDRRHPYLSVMLSSLLLIPVVYMVQLVILAISLNLPLALALNGTLLIAAVVEEVARSAGIVVLLENGIVRSTKQVLVLAFLSACGFLIGEKALTFLSLSIVSQSALAGALFNSGFLLAPLAAHFVFTAIVCLLTGRLNVRYPYAVLAATVVHSLYNLVLVGGIR